MEEVEELIEIYNLLIRKYGKEEIIKDIKYSLISNLNKLSIELERVGNFEKAIKVYDVLIEVDKKIKKRYEYRKKELEEKLKEFNSGFKGYPRIIEFKADKDYIISGNTVTLSWQVKNALIIELYENNKERVIISQNSFDIELFTDKNIVNRNFKLVAKNENGVSQNKLQVVIFPLPIIDNVRFSNLDLKRHNIVLNFPSVNFNNSLINRIEFNKSKFTELSNLVTIIKFKEMSINSIFFANGFFNRIINEQRKISKLIILTWRKELRKILKKIMNID